jgi:hypothetical protein
MPNESGYLSNQATAGKKQSEEVFPIRNACRSSHTQGEGGAAFFQLHIRFWHNFPSISLSVDLARRPLPFPSAVVRDRPFLPNGQPGIIDMRTKDIEWGMIPSTTVAARVK